MIKTIAQTGLMTMLLIGVVGLAGAQVPATAPVVEVVAQDRPPARDVKPPPVIDDNRKAELLQFVNEHQAGVARLLSVLEQRNPQQYQRSLESLDRDVRRLENTQSRDPEMYDIGLKRWKNSSAIELLLANISLRAGNGDDEARQGQIRRLRQLVEVREELRAQQLTLEIARMGVRLENLEEQLAVSVSDRRQIVEKSANELFNRAKRKRINNNSPPANDKLKGDGG